jgi:hypothetical protein
MVDCGNQVRLDAYHDGELSPAERCGVEAHLRDCPSCAAELAAMRGMSATFADTIPREPSHEQLLQLARSVPRRAVRRPDAPEAVPRDGRRGGVLLACALAAGAYLSQRTKAAAHEAMVLDHVAIRSRPWLCDRTARRDDGLGAMDRRRLTRPARGTMRRKLFISALAAIAWSSPAASRWASWGAGRSSRQVSVGARRGIGPHARPALQLQRIWGEVAKSRTPVPMEELDKVDAERWQASTSCSRRSSGRNSCRIQERFEARMQELEQGNRARVAAAEEQTGRCSRPRSGKIRTAPGPADASLPLPEEPDDAAVAVMSHRVSGSGAGFP